MVGWGQCSGRGGDRLGWVGWGRNPPEPTHLHPKQRKTKTRPPKIPVSKSMSETQKLPQSKKSKNVETVLSSPVPVSCPLKGPGHVVAKVRVQAVAKQHQVGVGGLAGETAAKAVCRMPRPATAETDMVEMG